MTVLLNRSLRTWDLADAVEVDGKLVRQTRDKEGNLTPVGKVVKRKMAPGASIEAIDQAESDHMLGYKNEIVDAEKAVPQIGDKVKALTDQVAALTDEIGGLRAKLAKYESDEAAGQGDDDKGKGGKKK